MSPVSLEYPDPVKFNRPRTLNSGIPNPTINMQKMNAVTCIIDPSSPDMSVVSKLLDTLGLDMAPKVPSKIYSSADEADDPTMTFLASTDGSR